MVFLGLGWFAVAAFAFAVHLCAEIGASGGGRLATEMIQGIIKSFLELSRDLLAILFIHFPLPNMTKG